MKDQQPLFVVPAGQEAKPPGALVLPGGSQGQGQAQTFKPELNQIYQRVLEDAGSSAANGMYKHFSFFGLCR